MNVYLKYDYHSIESLIECKETLVEIEEKIVDEEYDELNISGDFNSDPNEERFFKELKCFINAFELVYSDIERLPSGSYTYISRNQIYSNSWLDHVIT